VKYPLLLLLVVLAAGAWASPSEGRSAIEKEYAREADAASLHFARGMLSIRSADCQVFTPTGQRMNPDGDADRLRLLFRNALAVQEKVTIRSFHPTGPQAATCLIDDRIEVTKMTARGPRTMAVQSQSQDDWAETPLGWRQKAVHVLRQHVEILSTGQHR
jgi:hypothetical protein